MILWDRDHHSKDKRFWCYKAPRAPYWQLFDSKVKDQHGNSRRHIRNSLKECKELAEHLTQQETA